MAKRSAKSRLFAIRPTFGLMRAALLLLLGGAAAIGAFALAVSGISRTANPDTALKFIASESTALSAKADLLFFANPQKPPKSVRTLATAALREQAINPRALRLLGYLAELDGNGVQAGKARSDVCPLVKA